jgi:multicomponent Na+:H+ antiporter subunit G
MTDVIIGVLVVGGSLFIFLAALGVATGPDLYVRLSTLTKAPTMGVGLLIIATVIETPAIDVALRAGAILVFSFFSSPITAHMICRAAYFQRVDMWAGTVMDELHGRYDPVTHELKGPERSTGSG